jgi:ADP-ribosylglycohydrolase
VTKAEKFEGCIIGGAIGDAYGSYFENIEQEEQNVVFYLFGQPEKQEYVWQITDDTQLTLATCDAIIKDKSLNPSTFAKEYLQLFQARKLSGLGSSTLKALQELNVGGHWSQVGRRGEFAAGNGAAMRIAPLAFCENISKSQIRDICSITHNNDEAYVGAYSIFVALKAILNGNWTGSGNLIDIVVDQIQDTRVRDRLIEVRSIKDLKTIGDFGNSGYVVDSVPLAIAAANMINELSITEKSGQVEDIFEQLIEIGGDTDTNCSMAGQILGTLLGKDNLPKRWIEKLEKLNDYKWIETTIHKFIKDVDYSF